MSQYRKEVNEIEKEARWTMFRVLPLLIIALIIVAALSFALRSVGLIGKTVVEKKVFEQSYQRSEGLKSGIAMYEAKLASVNSRLMSVNLTEQDKQDLLAQKAALNIQISAIKGKI